jgi:small subunit ribosomal protein S18
MLRNTKSNTTLSQKLKKSNNNVGLKKKSTLKVSKKRSFSTTTLIESSTLQQSTAFRKTKKQLKLAFPEDYNEDVSPNPPKRDYSFDSSLLIGHLDANFEKKMLNGQENPRRFDVSEDEELYDHLTKNDSQLEQPKPSFEDYQRAKTTLSHLHNDSEVVDFTGKDSRFDWLDPFNPPNLTYQHVKLLKNIDYSPLIKRANEGGMFTVEDVITILQEEGVTDAFKTSMRREHAQDPVIYAKTYDVFNRGRKPCPLCLPDPTVNQVNRIHYTNVNLLRKFISTSGMIIPRKVSGVCASHQKKLRYAVKNAKQLALLSFTSNWHVPLSYVDPSKFEAYDDQMHAADVERERRLEIKALFDNLVADKKALLAGKTLEQIEAEKAVNDVRAERAELGPDDPIVEGTEEAQAQAIRTTDWATLGKESKEDQHNARLKQLQDRFQAQIAKAGGDDDKITAIKAAYAQEEKNIINDYETAELEENDENMDQLRADFGDLLDLDQFNIEMTFDEFLSKYNDRIEAKRVPFADHADVVPFDSEDEGSKTVGMRLRAEHAEMLKDELAKAEFKKEAKLDKM